MQAVKLEVWAVVSNLAHAIGSGEHAGNRIGDYGVVRPTSLPELVDDLHIVLGHRIAFVVRPLSALPRSLCGAVEIAGDDVPTDAAVGQMIERRHASGEGKRRLVGKRHRDAEAEMLGDGGHGGDEQQRIVDGRLRRVLQRGVGASAEHVVDAQHVGQEEPVEQAALERLRQLNPTIEAAIVSRAIARMAPKSR